MRPIAKGDACLAHLDQLRVLQRSALEIAREIGGDPYELGSGLSSKQACYVARPDPVAPEKVHDSQKAYAAVVVPSKRFNFMPYSFVSNHYWPEAAAKPAAAAGEAKKK